MIDKLKQEIMRRSFKLMTNPKVMKLMSDPRVMNAIARGFALKGQLQSQLESSVRSIAAALNLATREDVEALRRSIHEVEQSVADLDHKGETPPP